MSETTKPEGMPPEPPDTTKRFELSLERFDRALDDLSAVRDKLLVGNIMATTTAVGIVMTNRAVMRIIRFDNVFRLTAEALAAPRTAVGITADARAAMIEALVEAMAARAAVIEALAAELKKLGGGA